MWYWIVAQGGRLTLRDSVFETSVSHFYDPCPDTRDGKCNADGEYCPSDSDWVDCGSTPPPDAGPFGKLINVRSEVGPVVRGSSVMNLTLKSVRLVGAVNSFFFPPLQPSQAVQPRPDCGVVFGDEALCDPRAHCTPAQSGGVKCTCVGNGLRYKRGSRGDGQQCEQDTSLRAVLESESVAIAVPKPGSLANRTLTLIAEAHGEAELVVAFNVTMTRIEASSGAVITTNGSIRVDRPSMSAFGHHIEWRQWPPPASEWRADLDGSKLKFADSLRHEFTVRLACDVGEQSCAADGDVITTVVQLASATESHLRSEVRFITQVQSLLSCLHTRARTRIEPDSESVPVSTPMRVYLLVNDVDDLPMNFTRAEVSLSFSGRNVPVQWSRGSNLYVADVLAEVTMQPGVYDLVVSASNAWNETGSATSCELLRRTITVKEGLSTNSILGGAGGAAVGSSVGLSSWCGRGTRSCKRSW
jgi:hypothetical protein